GTRVLRFEAAPGMNRDELREISVPLDSSVAAFNASGNYG
ncbi:unnamed protein product, partial [marine sediment metagenome]